RAAHRGADGGGRERGAAGARVAEPAVRHPRRRLREDRQGEVTTASVRSDPLQRVENLQDPLKRVTTNRRENPGRLFCVLLLTPIHRRRPRTVMVENAPFLTYKHAGMTIEGYSRATVQSYWRIPELKLGFDLGAQPWD